MVFTALLGAGLGVPAFRVYGVGASDNPIYFLLVTLAFGELLVRVAISARSLTGGSTGMSGIPYPDLGLPDHHQLVQLLLPRAAASSSSACS